MGTMDDQERSSLETDHAMDATLSQGLSAIAHRSEASLDRSICGTFVMPSTQCQGGLCDLDAVATCGCGLHVCARHQAPERHD